MRNIIGSTPGTRAGGWRWRPPRVAVALCAVLVAGSLLHAATAAAAQTADEPIGVQAGCFGSGCAGKDPQAMGCNADARNIDGFSQHGAWPVSSNYVLDLRWSPACGAFWARLTNRHFGVDQVFYIRQCSTSSASTCSLKYQRTVPNNQYPNCCNSDWTPMIPTTEFAQACALTHYSDGRNSLQQCTGVH